MPPPGETSIQHELRSSGDSVGRTSGGGPRGLRQRLHVPGHRLGCRAGLECLGPHRGAHRRTAANRNGTVRRHDCWDVHLRHRNGCGHASRRLRRCEVLDSLESPISRVPGTGIRRDSCSSYWRTRQASSWEASRARLTRSGSSVIVLPSSRWARMVSASVPSTTPHPWSPTTSVMGGPGQWTWVSVSQRPRHGRILLQDVQTSATAFALPWSDSPVRADGGRFGWPYHGGVLPTAACSFTTVSWCSSHPRCTLELPQRSGKELYNAVPNSRD